MRDEKVPQTLSLVCLSLFLSQSLFSLSLSIVKADAFLPLPSEVKAPQENASATVKEREEAQCLQGPFPPFLLSFSLSLWFVIGRFLKGVVWY